MRRSTRLGISSWYAWYRGEREAYRGYIMFYSAYGSQMRFPAYAVWYERRSERAIRKR